jgi:hypothetical protein
MTWDFVLKLAVLMVLAALLAVMIVGSFKGKQ